MIPTGRLWVLLCLLALPMMAAGFFPGLGGAVLELLAARGVVARVRLVGMPDLFVPHGDARAQRAELGMDAAGLVRAAQALSAPGSAS